METATYQEIYRIAKEVARVSSWSEEQARDTICTLLDQLIEARDIIDALANQIASSHDDMHLEDLPPPPLQEALSCPTGP